ncbi:MAG: hypothetical protein J6Q57_02210 [Paraprevotella sp.]|nr:hypothetical protein [Paraprevotella sp.]
MKRNCLTLLFILAFGISSFATTQKGKFSAKDFIQKMERFITCEAHLTAAEANTFFPIFFEMHSKQRSVNKKIVELKKKAFADNADDKEYNNVVKEINRLKIEFAELEDTYYKKMCRAIPAKKVFAAMKAKDKFHRNILQQFNGKRQKK